MVRMPTGLLKILGSGVAGPEFVIVEATVAVIARPFAAVAESNWTAIPAFTGKVGGSTPGLFEPLTVMTVPGPVVTEADPSPSAQTTMPRGRSPKTLIVPLLYVTDAAPFRGGLNNESPA